jgi:SNF2 family DNA or RNA helicase
VSTLTAIVDLLDDFAIGRVLVVAPKKVARKTWIDEVNNWAHTRHLKVAIADGAPQERLAAIRQDAHITCIGRDNLVWLSNEIKASKKKWRWDMVVLDESSSFKNPDSKRFRAARRLIKFFGVEYVVELTGTPASNGYLNIWSQIFLLDGGERLYRGYKTFKDVFFKSDYMGYKYELTEGSEERIQEKIADRVLVLREEDYLSLPERIVVPVHVQLDSRQAKRYRELERDFLLTFGDDEIVAVNAGVLYGKLCQFATGDCYNEDREVIEVHNEKINELVDLVEELNGQPALLAYNYQHERDKVLAKFKGRGYEKGFVRELKTDQDIDDWNAGKIKLAVAHPQSIGHGLNLQFGGHNIIWYSTPSDLEIYLQFNTRLHRRGQKHPVMLYHLITEGTIESDVVLPRINQKDLDQRDLIKGVLDFSKSKRRR